MPVEIWRDTGVLRRKESKKSGVDSLGLSFLWLMLDSVPPFAHYALVLTQKRQYDTGQLNLVLMHVQCSYR